jgi:hypothetical protein
MLRPTEASVSCSNLSEAVTCEHVDSASSPTHLQSIGGGEKPREPDRGSPDTTGLEVPENPRVRAVSHGAALHGTSMLAPCLTKSRDRPLASSPSWGWHHPPRRWRHLVTHHQHLASPESALPMPLT